MASKASGSGGGRVPWRLIGWAIPVALLTIPLLNRWQWTASDFVVAGAMFAIVGGSFELAVRASGNLSYRLGAAVALATAFLLAWINLAVGIIGDENNPLNLIFFGVISAALAGSLAARFRAPGMAMAMTIAAGIQFSIGIAAFALGLGANEPPGSSGLFVLIEAFTFLWLLSAWLFRSAARAGSEAR